MNSVHEELDGLSIDMSHSTVLSYLTVALQSPKDLGSAQFTGCHGKEVK